MTSPVTFTQLFLVALTLPLCACGSKASPSQGLPGGTTIAKLSAPASVSQCSGGGNVLDYGIDKNGNGVLDSSEITGQLVICNGADGVAGSQGPAGVAGAQGPAGSQGENSLIALTPLAPGSACSGGGTYVSSGADLNGNGVLDASEVTVATNVCNGSSNSYGTTIYGSYTINNSIDAQLAAGVTSITGDLIIHTFDANSSFLPALHTVEGSVTIYAVTPNDYVLLSSLVGVQGGITLNGSGTFDLPQLQSAGGLMAYGANGLNIPSLETSSQISVQVDNFSAPSLASVETLSVQGSYVDLPKLASAQVLSLSGLVAADLPDFSKLVLNSNSALSIYPVISISNMPNLTSMAGFAGTHNLQKLSGLSVQNNNSLVSLAGLEGIQQVGSLSIYANPNLSNIDSLSGISSTLDCAYCQADIRIENNSVLRNLNGLANLTTLHSLSQIIITNNPLLQDISIFAPTSVSVAGQGQGGIYIQNNVSLNQCQAVNFCELSAIAAAVSNCIGEAGGNLDPCNPNPCMGNWCNLACSAPPYYVCGP